MKPVLWLFIFFIALAGHSALAASTNNPPAELSALINQVNIDIQAGKHTEQDLTNDLKQLEAFRAKYKKDKTDVMAMALYNEAVIYGEVIGNTNRSDILIKQLRHDYKKSHIVQEIEAAEAQEAAAQKIRAALKYGTPLPDFNEKDVAGNPVSVAKYKGKIVLVDFWATWCGPCLMQLPGVIDTYQKYHDKGFEVVGVSLDDNPPRLLEFIKESNMPWPEFNDGHRFDNKLAVKYGVEQIPTNFLLDRDGKIIGKDLRGDALPAMVANALPK